MSMSIKISEQSLISDFTLFVAPSDVHEQLPHQLARHLVEGPPFRGHHGVFGAIVPPHLEANSILGKEQKHQGVDLPSVGRTQLEHSGMHTSP